MSTSNEKRELFCEKCGEKLKLKSEKILGKFSRFSGKEFYVRLYECPNKKWAFDGHGTDRDTNNYFDIWADNGG